MKSRTLALIVGISYIIMFFAAIFANFFVLESILKNPLLMVQQHQLLVGFGILAFLVTIVLDVVIAWALYELYKQNPISRLSTYFRLMHAVIMGVALFALQMVLKLSSGAEIIQQVDIFNSIWLIGLFFFGIHLILLAKIIGKPKIMVWIVAIAGLMYMMDTVAHFMLTNYDAYATYFLVLVAVPSMIGEMSLAIWLLVKGGKN